MERKKSPDASTLPRKKLAFRSSLDDKLSSPILNNTICVIPKPPDGGYGWIILLASFTCGMIVNGISYAFGIYIQDMVSYYESSTNIIAFAGSLQTGLVYISGPPVAALTNKHGCRSVVIAGSIISCVAFVWSAFSKRLPELILSFGFIAGIGLGMIFLPTIVIVGYYFSTRRSFALGVISCSGGAGIAVLSPLFEALLKYYGWRGSLIIIAGMILNCVVLGALLRPLDISYNDDQKHNDCLKTKETDVNIGNSTLNENKDRLKGTSSTKARVKSPSLLLDQSFFTLKELYVSTGTDISKLPPFCYKSIPEESFSGSMKSIRKSFSRPLYRPDIFYLGNLNYRDALLHSKTEVLHYFLSVYKDVAKRKVSEKKSKWLMYFTISNSILEPMKEMLDFSLMRDKVFFLVCLYNVIAMIGFYIPYVYIRQASEAKGIPPHKTSFIVSLMGMCDVFGSISFGWLSDKKGINPLFVNSICMLVAGFFAFQIPSIDIYEILALDLALYALNNAAYICLMPVILVYILGLQKLTNSCGIVNFFIGVGAMIGPPIGGSIFDSTGSYDYLFYLLAITYVLGSLFSFISQFLFKGLKRETD